jgi:hypothetical protein
MSADAQTLGRTLTDAKRIEDAAAKTTAALAPEVRLVCGWDDNAAFAKRLFERIREQYSRHDRVHVAIVDDVPDSHFIGVTDCPYAHIAMEAWTLGVGNVKPFLMTTAETNDEESAAYYRELLAPPAQAGAAGEGEPGR